MLRACVLAGLTAAGPGAAEDPRGLRSHDHGVADIGMALDGALVALDLRATGFDIVGFEYPAERPADIAAIDAALELLRDADALFGFPEPAGCTLTEADVALEQIGTGRAAHSEFQASYVLTCRDGAAIDAVTMDLFDKFESLRRLDVVVVDSSGAQAVELGRADPVLRLR